ANQTLDTMPYDPLQRNDAASKDDLYDKIAKADFEGIGKDWTEQAPQTLFSGLQVQKPLSEEQLTEVVMAEPDIPPPDDIVERLPASEAAPVEAVLSEPENADPDAAQAVEPVIVS